MKQHRTITALFWVATAALVSGALFVPLALASIPLYIVAGLLRLGAPQDGERLLFWSGVFFSGMAGVGFVILYYYWGRLDYSLTGYVVLLGPFLALCTAFALALTYHSTRRLRNERP